MSNSLKGFKKEKRKEHFKNVYTHCSKYFYIIGIVMIVGFLLSPLPYGIWYHNQVNFTKIVYTIFFLVFGLISIIILIHILMKYEYNTTITSKKKFNLIVSFITKLFLSFVILSTILFQIGRYTYPLVFLPSDGIDIIDDISPDDYQESIKKVARLEGGDWFYDVSFNYKWLEENPNRTLVTGDWVISINGKTITINKKYNK